MTAAVPDDFPWLEMGSSLGGAQFKLSISRDRDGKFREVGASLDEREHDFMRCQEVIHWGVDFLRQKSLKPKYAGLRPDELIAKLRINLDRDFDMPAVYRDWILLRISDLLEKV